MGFRPVVGISHIQETNEERTASFSYMKYVTQLVLLMGGVNVELSAGWKYHIEAERSSARTNRHIHVWKNGEMYAQNVDGSPRDGSSGDPPNSVRKELYQKTGWDWNKKKQSYENTLNPMIIHVLKDGSSDCGSLEGKCTCHQYLRPYMDYGTFIPYVPSPNGIPTFNFHFSPVPHFVFP